CSRSLDWALRASCARSGVWQRFATNWAIVFTIPSHLLSERVRFLEGHDPIRSEVILIHQEDAAESWSTVRVVPAKPDHSGLVARPRLQAPCPLRPATTA